jgi:type IV secretory pathway VirB10-like protein
MRADDPLAPPPLPPVRRLTRAVWIVAALVFGGTVFLIVFLVAPRRQSAPPPPPPLLAPSDPTFLQHPAGTPSETPSADVLAEREALRHLAEGVPASGPGASAAALSPRSGDATAAAANPPAARDPRREAFLRALAAPLARAAAAPPVDREEGSPAGVAGIARWLSTLNPVTAAPALAPSPAPASPVAAAPPLSPRAELRRLAASSARGRLVAAGTVLPALLLTAVASDLPGHLLAQVSRDVFDARQQVLLVPKGTRLLGRYENQIALAQSRLLVAWTRLVLPDGTAFELPGLPGVDGGGAAGLPAHADRHLGTLFGDALLLSVLAAGAQLSQPQTATFANAPSAGNVAAGALGQELTATGLEILRRGRNVQPTLSLPAGTPLLVFVNGDLDMAPSVPGVADALP